MLNHAVSLATDGLAVDLVGYPHSPLPDEVENHPLITVHPLAVPERPAHRHPLSPQSALRAYRQYRAFARVLAHVLKDADTLLLQIPPAIPALSVALAACRRAGADLVVDWHNFTHSMLALKLSPHGLPVKLVRWHERRLAGRAAAHLCVSEAMQRELAEQAGLDAVVVRDRPTSRFKPLTAEERAAFRERLFKMPALEGAGRSDRPRAWLVSPTSWSLDEDFSLLLDAAVRYEEAVRENPALPDLLVLLTGRGPGRRAFEERAARAALHHVDIRTLWLDPEDYPRLLGAADLGLCFHRSASGVDLPIKISDMADPGSDRGVVPLTTPQSTAR